MKHPEQYRLMTGKLGSNSSYGNSGAFIIPHYKISGYFINCISGDGEGWQHVSVSLTKSVSKIGRARKNIYGSVENTGGVHLIRENIEKIEVVERCPTWAEMCFVKSLFWDDEETVMQLHSPKSTWVNVHEFCLHLWKPDNKEIPLPDPLMVGIKV